mgnify:CR=1 FL=1
MQAVRQEACGRCRCLVPLLEGMSCPHLYKSGHPPASATNALLVTFPEWQRVRRNGTGSVVVQANALRLPRASPAAINQQMLQAAR